MNKWILSLIIIVIGSQFSYWGIYFINKNFVYGYLIFPLIAVSISLSEENKLFGGKA